MTGRCTRCGAVVHAWRMANGVCEACVDPTLRAFEVGDARRRARVERWGGRARRGRWWALGLGGFGALIAVFAGAFALAAHACGGAVAPAIELSRPSRAGDEIVKHAVNGFAEALRGFSALR